LRSLLFPRPVMIGLDIQTNGIRLIGLKKNKHQFHIECIATTDFDAQTIFVESKIKYWDTLVTILAKLVDQLKIRDRPVAIHLPVHFVKMGYLQLPLGLSDEQIKTEIYAQAKHDWQNKEDLSLDFSQQTLTHAACSEILFVTANREYLSQYIQCVCSAGLRVQVVDVDIYALIRVLQYTDGLLFEQNVQREWLQKDAHAIIYITQTIVTLVLFTWQTIISYQYWPINETEEDWLQLSDKILTCLQSFSDKEIKRLIICGHSRYISRLIESVTQVYRLPVCFPEIFAHIKPPVPIDSAADFLVACGLAMRNHYKW